MKCKIYLTEINVRGHGRERDKIFKQGMGKVLIHYITLTLEMSKKNSLLKFSNS